MGHSGNTDWSTMQLKDNGEDPQPFFFCRFAFRKLNFSNVQCSSQSFTDLGSFSKDWFGGIGILTFALQFGYIYGMVLVEPL